MVEHQPAIVHGVVAELRPDVSDFDPLARGVILRTPDLNQKGINAKRVPINDTLSKDDSMISPAP